MPRHFTEKQCLGRGPRSAKSLSACMPLWLPVALLSLFGCHAKAETKRRAAFGDMSLLKKTCDDFVMASKMEAIQKYCIPEGAAIGLKAENLLDDDTPPQEYVGDILKKSPGSGKASVATQVQRIVCTSPLCRSAILAYDLSSRECNPLSRYRSIAVAWRNAKENCREVPQGPTEKNTWVVQAKLLMTGMPVESDADMLRVQDSVVRYITQQYFDNSYYKEETRTADKVLRVTAERCMNCDGRIESAPPTPSPVGPNPGKCCKLRQTFPYQNQTVPADVANILVQFDCPVMLSDEGMAMGALSISLISREGQCAGDAVRTQLPPEFVYLKDSVPHGNNWANNWVSIPLQQPLFTGLSSGAVYRYHLKASDFKSADGEAELCDDVAVEFKTRGSTDSPVVHTAYLQNDRDLKYTWNMPVKSPAKESSPLMTVEATSIAVPTEGGKKGMFPLITEVNDTCPERLTLDLCQKNVKNGLPPCSRNNRLPCGLQLKLIYPKGFAESLEHGRASLGSEIVPISTSPCSAPVLNEDAECAGGSCGDLKILWMSCTEVANFKAKITVCAMDFTDPACEVFTIDDASVSRTPVKGRKCSSEWVLKGRGRPHVCGRLSVSVEGGAVRSADDGSVQHEVQKALSPAVQQCGTFIETAGNFSCWLVFDTKFRAQGGPAGKDAFNFRDDLKATHVPYREITNQSEMAVTLKRGTFMPRCILTPELRHTTVGDENADGRIEPDIWRRYVQAGGVLMLTGGWKQIDGINSIFHLTKAPAFAGNHMLLNQNNLPEEVQGAKLSKELPILNAMHCVMDIDDSEALESGEAATLGITKGRQALGVVHTLYGGAQGEGAGGEGGEVGGGFLQIASGHGYADYITFDWHDPDTAKRVPWTGTLKTVLYAQVTHADKNVNSKKVNGVVQRRLGWEAPASATAPPPPAERSSNRGSPSVEKEEEEARRARARSNLHETLPPLQVYSEATPDFVVHPQYFGSLLSDYDEEDNPELADEHERRLTAAGSSLATMDASSERRLWQSNVTAAEAAEGLIVTINLRCPSPENWPMQSPFMRSACEEPVTFLKAMSKATSTQQSAKLPVLFTDWLRGKPANYRTPEVDIFSDPVVYAARSPCPSWKRIQRRISTMLRACNLSTVEGYSAPAPDRFPFSVNASLISTVEPNIVVTEQGVETFYPATRREVCPRPVCHRWVQKVYSTFMNSGGGNVVYKGCPNSAGRKGHEARLSKALRNVMKSCQKVKAITGNVRLQLFTKSIDTSSPEELNFLGDGLRRWTAEVLDPKLFERKGEGGMLSWMPGSTHIPGAYPGVLNMDLVLTVSVEPADSDKVPFKSTTQFVTGDSSAVPQPQTWTHKAEEEWLTNFNPNHFKPGLQIHNINMTSIRPQNGAMDVNPATKISISFPDLVTPVKYSSRVSSWPVIQIYPKRMEHICGECHLCGKKRDNRWYPMETGFPTAPTTTPLNRNYQCKDGTDCTPPQGALYIQQQISFTCQEYEMDNEDVVQISGQVLTITPSHPLERHTEYVVKFPRGTVTYAGSSMNPDVPRPAAWAGWPEGSDYSFTTGAPASSNTKFVFGLGCNTLDECLKSQVMLDQRGPCIVARASCKIADFRANRATMSHRHRNVPFLQKCAAEYPMQACQKSTYDRVIHICKLAKCRKAKTTGGDKNKIWACSNTDVFKAACSKQSNSTTADWMECMASNWRNDDSGERSYLPNEPCLAQAITKLNPFNFDFFAEEEGMVHVDFAEVTQHAHDPQFLADLESEAAGGAGARRLHASDEETLAVSSGLGAAFAHDGRRLAGESTGSEKTSSPDKSIIAMAGIPVEVKNIAPYTVIPKWIFLFPFIAVVCCILAVSKGVAWLLDMYIDARKYDPHFEPLRNSIIPISLSISSIIIVTNVLIGAVIAMLLYHIFVHFLKVAPVNLDIELYEQVLECKTQYIFASLVAGSSATASLCSWAMGVIGRFKSTWRDAGQIFGLVGIIFAAGGVAAGTAGWSASGALDKVDPACSDLSGSFLTGGWKKYAASSYLHGVEASCPQYAFEGLIFAIVLESILSQWLAYYFVVPVSCLVLQLYPFNRFRISGVALYYWQKRWADWNTGVKDVDPGFILYVWDIRFNETLQDWLYTKKFVPGILSLEFRSSLSPQNACSTRSFPMNKKEAYSSSWMTHDNVQGFKLSGEKVSLTITNPFDVVEMTLMVQPEQGAYPAKIATTTFDPWTGAVLGTYVKNLRAIEPYRKALINNCYADPNTVLDEFEKDPSYGCQIELGLLAAATYCKPTTPRARERFDSAAYATDAMATWSQIRTAFGDDTEAEENARKLSPKPVGLVAFTVTHMGHNILLDQKDDPSDEPIRKQALGDTVRKAALESRQTYGHGQ
eukprot:TRINITY_DN24892_c0_g1_i1.p1 TRINITY_DN24892_c0_g1~~TRINITY_DN24892_c0_g1_i1.p1  ORF type:complete len:2368 (-),score=372.31 TRINITY_DN24892_c0_g1_i1:577-7680(-)